MDDDNRLTYRIRDFSALTGVSVRALHHYDRLGLLRPRRTRSGYRLYTAADVSVLEQIVALKFIGVSLQDIKRLLRSDRRELTVVLEAQRVVLEEKRRRLDLTIGAIRQAQAIDEPDDDQLRRIIEVITMQDQRKEWQQQYDALVQGRVDRMLALSPEMRDQLRRQFAELATEVQGALRDDPDGPRAQALAERWLELLGTIAPNGKVDPQLLKYAAAYLSDGSWPAGTPHPEPPFGRSVWEFMGKAIAARH